MEYFATKDEMSWTKIIGVGESEMPHINTRLFSVKLDILTPDA